MNTAQRTLSYARKPVFRSGSRKKIPLLVIEAAQAACERFDIVALLRNVSKAGRSITHDKPIAVMDVSCADSLMIHSDEAKVTRIMMGLMNNAVQSTDRGRIALILGREADEIRLTVTDTGRGMEQEQINAVLAPSDPEDDHKMVVVATSGLGLRTVKALVKQLNGEISIASQTGKGSIVAVSLPMTSGNVLTNI